MSINLDKEPNTTKELVDELELSTLLIRFPLWEMARLEEYLEFVKVYNDKKIVRNVMHDRENVEDLAWLK